MYVVRYLDGEFFDKFNTLEEAVLWAEMIDGVYDDESEE